MLQLNRVSVSFRTPAGPVRAVRDVSMDVGAGECLAVVGESGAGKTQTFRAVVGLLGRNSEVTGEVYFQNADLLKLRGSDLNRIRGSQIAMIFQNPGESLTPHLRVADQLAEPLVRHRKLGKRGARIKALELLHRVGMVGATDILDRYPHQLSGGMRQRVAIAIALACEPLLLIADEPTNALDVTSQAQILELLAEFRREHGMSMIWVTHDFGVAARVADRVAVMDAGYLVEIATAKEIFNTPKHPRTQALLNAARSLRMDGHQPLSNAANGAVPQLDIAELSVSFQNRRRFHGRPSIIHALTDINLQILEGEAVGVVGESGSGKSTLAHALVGLVRPSSGRMTWSARSPALRTDVQIIFQDALASLNPRMKVADIVMEPLRIHRPHSSRESRDKSVRDVLRDVGLEEVILNRYPHELSGGQCQRVAIARAIVIHPKLLVCDEPISSLDVSTQLTILNLLLKLKRQKGISILFISHDLSAVRRLCDRALVLYRGEMLECRSAHSLFTAPSHPHTKALLDAIPLPDPTVRA